MACNLYCIHASTILFLCFSGVIILNGKRMVLPDDLCHLRVYDSGYLSPIVWTTFQESVNVEDREDRPVPFATAIFSYIVGLVTLRFLGAPFIFSGLMFAYVGNTALAAVITKYLTKVSIHTWGITGPSVAILFSFGAVPFLVLVVGLVLGTARVTLGYHTWAQVALSFLTAVPFTWLILYIVPIAVPTVFRS
ncbi:hypothetical protein AUF78_04595 [archaeon 13_1_20CM_2_51_12]|nr:MAG: hypothetical protein AUF78_04595 [archaeon 13_1_20CM_2_51_12]